VKADCIAAGELAFLGLGVPSGRSQAAFFFWRAGSSRLAAMGWTCTEKGCAAAKR
jgi:hypothetical protein